MQPKRVPVYNAFRRLVDRFVQTEWELRPLIKTGSAMLEIEPKPAFIDLEVTERQLSRLRNEAG